MWRKRAEEWEIRTAKFLKHISNISKWPHAEPTANYLLEQKVVISLLTETANLNSKGLEKIGEHISYLCSLLPWHNPAYQGSRISKEFFPDLPPNFLPHVFSSHTLSPLRLESQSKPKSLNLMKMPPSLCKLTSFSWCGRLNNGPTKMSMS